MKVHQNRVTSAFTILQNKKLEVELQADWNTNNKSIKIEIAAYLEVVVQRNRLT